MKEEGTGPEGQKHKAYLVSWVTPHQRTYPHPPNERNNTLSAWNEENIWLLDVPGLKKAEVSQKGEFGWKRLKINSNFEKQLKEAKIHRKKLKEAQKN